MATITETLTAAQDQVLEVIEKVQEPAVDAVRSLVEAVEGVLPDDRPRLRTGDLVPDPAALVELSFSFAQKLLDNQHDFAKAILDAVAPLLPEAPKAKKPAAAKKAQAA